MIRADGRGPTAAEYLRDAAAQVEEQNAVMAAEARAAREADPDAGWGFLESACGERVTADEVRSDDA